MMEKFEMHSWKEFLGESFSPKTVKEASVSPRSYIRIKGTDTIVAVTAYYDHDGDPRCVFPVDYPGLYPWGGDKSCTYFSGEDAAIMSEDELSEVLSRSYAEYKDHKSYHLLVWQMLPAELEEKLLEKVADRLAHEIEWDEDEELEKVIFTTDIGDIGGRGWLSHIRLPFESVTWTRLLSIEDAKKVADRIRTK